MDAKQPSRSHDVEASADEALAEARSLPPGPERIEALKTAGKLRYAADVYGIIFAKRGRPSR
ncbi:MAG: hypothetical protein Q7J60_24520 [Bradyrhizobium sp.]|uniref:hypothetical protein n=1 Tax=Bradyrhizobium sp. TaxID=376 RepID=UPI00271BE0F4|nr:hypothetical protein [Bradyrhizobium sp.]MDO9564797.1 hypothetical protein [Bradyrhizobium sp.]MDP3690918.1 hypothetical protein [Bradyrhizobium sp.]